MQFGQLEYWCGVVAAFIIAAMFMRNDGGAAAVPWKIWERWVLVAVVMLWPITMAVACIALVGLVFVGIYNLARWLCGAKI